MNTLTRQQENSAWTRQALLISAHGLFIEKGYQSVSIDEIARDARVTKGAFYHHFKSKSDLMQHCYEIQLQKISDALDNIEPLADKWEELKTVVRSFINYLEQYYRELIPVQEVMPVIGWYEFEDINRRYISNRVDNIINQLKAEQIMKEYDSYLLCSLIHGFMMHITLNINSLAEFPGFKDDFTEIYNNFLQTLKKSS
ncbi:transposase [Morganella morganii]|uniref:Transposase n=1 Tax=Morganella morganii TaxID=582 RepID=A0A433ZXA2_MORMO|nr:TetR/AcrR family transcriptional regulator [Morganella morganii]RUT66761.1 transposase [Morganella morganii]